MNTFLMINMLLGIILWFPLGRDPEERGLTLWMYFILYIFLCMYLTPLIGIPLYRHLFSH